MHPTSPADPGHKWWVLAIIGIGILMSTLDISIVNIALPTILTSFQTDLVALQWVVEAYLLAITVLLLPFGRLSDMVGRKKVYTAGFLVFTAGSGLCGISESVEQLILFRVLQAVGAAMITANGFAIVTAVFPPRLRGTALGINGTVVAAGLTLGPTIGGLLIYSLGWRWIFLVNLPIGLIGTAAAQMILREEHLTDRPADAPRFDIPGAVTSALALTALLMALTLGPEIGWDSPFILASAALFVAFSVAFLAIETRVGHPIVDLALFHRRTFTAGNLAGLLAFLAISANAFLMPFFLQLVLGYSPLRAGLVMTATPLVMAVVAPISGWLSDRLGARLLSSTGLAINALALLMLGTLTVESSEGDVLRWLVLLGVGQGMFQSPNNSSVMGDVPRDRLGIGSGLLSMMRNVGSVVGVAISASFLLSSLSALHGRASLGELQLGGQIAPETLDAFVVGLHQAYRAAALFAVLGVVSSLVRGSRPAPPVRLAERRREGALDSGSRLHRRARW
ncbi:MAG: MFS transporter [Chloroflexota bacterium]